MTCLCGEHPTHEIHITEEFEILSRLIILNKILYYYPEKLPSKIHETWQVVDEAYDQFERRYLLLCNELGLTNTLVHKDYPDLPKVPGTGMMEVDFARSDVQAVILKFTNY